jgi:hypothetical protein
MPSGLFLRDRRVGSSVGDARTAEQYILLRFLVGPQVKSPVRNPIQRREKPHDVGKDSTAFRTPLE